LFCFGWGGGGGGGGGGGAEGLALMDRMLHRIRETSLMLVRGAEGLTIRSIRTDG